MILYLFVCIHTLYRIIIQLMVTMGSLWLKRSLVQHLLLNTMDQVKINIKNNQLMNNNNYYQRVTKFLQSV